LREWFNSSGPQRLWQGVILGAGTLYNIVVKLPWLVAIVVVTVLLIQGLFQRTTAIDSISVPKALAERGYTPEIAAQRLHDAFKQIALDARTFMRSPKVALRGELPSITVPTVWPVGRSRHFLDPRLSRQHQSPQHLGRIHSQGRPAFAASADRRERVLQQSQGCSSGKC
jgi:hypothetical protein